MGFHVSNSLAALFVLKKACWWAGDLLWVMAAVKMVVKDWYYYM